MRRTFLEEYRKKLSELAQDVNVGNISIDPFELMAGDISGLSNVEVLLSDAETTEKNWEVVGNHREYKEIFGFRRWVNKKFGTNFQCGLRYR